MRILLVEDHEQVAQSTIMLLKLMGHDVDHANNGREAVRIAAQIVPQLMLIDIGLPDITGFEVANQLRLLPELRQTVMVALTGYDCDDKEKFKVFDHYYKKPMNFDKLPSFLVAV